MNINIEVKNNLLFKELEINFLNNIYHGEKLIKDSIPVFLYPYKDALTITIDFLASTPYDITKDLGENPAQGEEQRKHLRIIRDAILADQK